MLRSPSSVHAASSEPGAAPLGLGLDAHSAVTLIDLGALVNAGAGAGAGASGGAGPGSWIVKPPRGSQGSGIRVLSGAARLFIAVPPEKSTSDGFKFFCGSQVARPAVHAAAAPTTAKCARRRTRMLQRVATLHAK